MELVKTNEMTMEIYFLKTLGYKPRTLLGSNFTFK